VYYGRGFIFRLRTKEIARIRNVNWRFRDSKIYIWGKQAPLLEQERWREALGWSLTDNRADSIPTAFL